MNLKILSTLYSNQYYTDELQGIRSILKTNTHCKISQFLFQIYKLFRFERNLKLSTIFHYTKYHTDALQAIERILKSNTHKGTS